MSNVRYRWASLGPLRMIQMNFGSFKGYDMKNRFFSRSLAGGALLDIGASARAHGGDQRGQHGGCTPLRGARYGGGGRGGARRYAARLYD